MARHDLNRRELLGTGVGILGSVAAVSEGNEIDSWSMPATSSPAYFRRPDQGLTFAERHYVDYVDQHLPYWEGTGHLAGLESEEQRRAMVAVLQNQTWYNETESRDGCPISKNGDGSKPLMVGGTDDRLSRISIALAARVMRRLFQEAWLPIQPLVGPIGVITAWSDRMAKYNDQRGFMMKENFSVLPECSEYLLQDRNGEYCRDEHGLLRRLLYTTSSDIHDVVTWVDMIADQMIRTVLQNIFYASQVDRQPENLYYATSEIIAIHLRKHAENYGIKGYVWALVPPTISVPNFVEHLESMEVRVFRRNPDPRQPMNDSTLIGFRADQMSENTFFLCPSVPVRLTSPLVDGSSSLSGLWGQKWISPSQTHFIYRSIGRNQYIDET